MLGLATAELLIIPVFAVFFMALGLLSVFLGFYAKYRRIQREIQQDESKRREKYYEALEKDGKSITREIQLKNLEGTADYFRISKFHVRVSFGFSVFSCIVGLVFLGIAVFQALSDASFEAALIPAIGGAVTEFVAVTIFWVHRKSAKQLNRYYDSLHEIEVFLSTTDMIDQLSTPEKKDEAIMLTLSELYQVQKIKTQNETKTKGK